ncbi:MAG: YIP1 family protein [Candidatus Omnitrophica bacterium]|nr:YIP1 family protein [Candidatus Omnitrophota bacterium]
MSSFANRIARAMKLESSVYEEIEHDPEALGQAMLVVALSSAAAGFGVAPWLGIGGLFWILLAAFAGWVFWAGIIYFVGTRLLGTPSTQTNLAELLRVIGFASAPGLFRIFGFFVAIQDIVFWVTGVWMLIAMIIAVRQALDFLSTGRAVAVCVIGWLLHILIVVLLIRIVGAFYGTNYSIA